jgi:hypothetical protein
LQQQILRGLKTTKSQSDLSHFSLSSHLVPQLPLHPSKFALTGSVRPHYLDNITQQQKTRAAMEYQTFANRRDSRLKSMDEEDSPLLSRESTKSSTLTAASSTVSVTVDASSQQS